MMLARDPTRTRDLLRFLLDPFGVILARVEGLGQPVDALRERLRARR